MEFTVINSDGIFEKVFGSTDNLIPSKSSELLSSLNLLKLIVWIIFWSLFLVVLTKFFICKESENNELFKELISRFKNNSSPFVSVKTGALIFKVLPKSIIIFLFKVIPKLFSFRFSLFKPLVSILISETGKKLAWNKGEMTFSPSLSVAEMLNTGFISSSKPIGGSNLTLIFPFKSDWIDIESIVLLNSSK